jgi:hypothetical protein
LASKKLQLAYYNVLQNDSPEVKLEMTNSLGDELLSANLIAKSLSMIDINMHGHHLQFLARRVYHLLVLIIPFQMRTEVEPVHSSIEYLHKRFD